MPFTYRWVVGDRLLLKKLEQLGCTPKPWIVLPVEYRSWSTLGTSLNSHRISVQRPFLRSDCSLDHLAPRIQLQLVFSFVTLTFITHTHTLAHSHTHHP